MCRALLPQDLRAHVFDLLWNGRRKQQRLTPRTRCRHVSAHQDVGTHDLQSLFQHLVRLIQNHRLHICER
eukprot:Skav233398  [mRNA]  locus=scaffold4184:21390:26473:+ [translate_table: standard]